VEPAISGSGAFALSGQVAIVTGAAGGLGRAYALELARHGCQVAVADLAPATAVSAEIAAAGGTAFPVEVDVSDRQSTQAMAEAVHRWFGHLDILVNNAGYFRHARRGMPLEDITVEEWDRAFAVNVRGTWLCVRAVVPFMKQQRRGRIINVSSQTAWIGTPGFLHYVASKSAVVGLTRCMATELGEHNIAVNTVVPDLIPHDLEYARSHPELDQRVVARRVFKRTQVPDDMTGLVVFLAGPWSAFITGQSFLVNGGSFYQ
jgi:NAD(P)-dependent dehydrogenase (short-subunit alcohol dehydrogenase family)